jgi:D-3-phosphoglycerate dehydrogenase
MTMKALVVDHIHQDGISLLKGYCKVDIRINIGTNDLANIVGDYDILLGRATTLTPRIEYPLLENVGKLKVIGIASVGLDRVDLDYVASKNVHLINLPGVNAVSVAEHTFALLLALVRDVPKAYSQILEGKWNNNAFPHAREISGKTLGIIGLGHIGRQVASIAGNGFSMNILAYDPYLDEKPFHAVNAKRVSLPELLRTSDIVSIHAPLTKETYRMIGRDELFSMKQGSILLNLGRGGIVDESALYDALASNHLFAAALDVQEQEPCYESPLFSLPNFLATPHLAGLTDDALRRAGVRVVREALAVVGISVD